MAQQVFERKEIKYLLTQQEYDALLREIEPYLQKDHYFEETNCSIYFDNDLHYLAVHSMDKPLYKEKVRLRSYNTPKLNDKVFLEIKKKFNGVGSKRRVEMPLKDYYQYVDTGLSGHTSNPQIQKELDYCIAQNHLKPVLYLAYDRRSYNDRATNQLRITFDANVRYREDDLRLEHGSHGQQYFTQPMYVMETKTMGAYPMWLVHALSHLNIYPTSFQKYGSVYQKILS